MSNTIIAINAIMIDNICNGSDNGLAIMPGRDDLTREIALLILTLAASGFRASVVWPYLAGPIGVRYCKPV